MGKTILDRHSRTNDDVVTADVLVLFKHILGRPNAL